MRKEDIRVIKKALKDYYVICSEQIVNEVKKEQRSLMKSRAKWKREYKKEKRKVKELLAREEKVKNRINEALDFAKMGDCEKYYGKQIQCLEAILKIYEE